MIRKSALAATIAALLNPAVAGALGLGNIEVSSALNEPLKARIPLRGVDSGAAEELKAALGSDEQFSRAGLDRVFVLSTLRFKVVQSGASSGHIEITTRDPVAEPFLNFLVDVNWSNGRVLREYTVLLDPPVYGAAIRSATARRVETVSALPAPTPAAKPAASNFSASSAPPMAPASSTGTASGFSGDSYGPVRDGETLWSIADRVRPGGTSIQNMMLALLRTNPQAFSIDNVNALKTGAVLRIPAASEVRDDRAQALAEVARQHGLWDEYRQSIGASAQPQPGVAAAQSGARAMTDSGDSGNAEMAKSPTPGGSSSSELKLVGGGTSGTTVGGGVGNEADIQALRDNLSIAQEEAEAAKLENSELQSRLGEVEGIVEDMKRLVELREDQLAALQDQLAKTEQAREAGEGAQTMASGPAMEAKPEPAEKPMATPEPSPDKPATTVAEPKPEPMKEPSPPVVKAPPAPPPPPVPEPTSLLGDIQAMVPVPLWTVLAGVGALLLGFGGLRMARARKQATSDGIADVVAPDIDESGSLIDQYAQTELPNDDVDEDVTEMAVTESADAATMVEDDDQTEMAKTSTSEPAGTGTSDEDPLAEVNVYLAYERFDQAEQLVRDAIETYPERAQYRLKLLEVFYAAKNVVAYELAAEELQAAVGPESEMVEQARVWWNELGTGRELFSDDDGPDTAQRDDAQVDSGGDDDLFDVTSAESGEQTGVDFDLGFDAPDGDAAEGGSDLDFDLGASDDAAGSSGDGELDFDLDRLGETGGGAEEPPATQRLNPAGVAAAAAGVAAAGAAGAAALESSTDLDFDLGASDFGESTADDAAVSAADESVDTGLDFAIDTDSSAGSGSDDSVPERIGGDDSSDLDFDFSSLDDSEQSGAAGDELDFSLDDGSDSTDGGESVLDFDLGDTTSFDGDSASSDPLQDATRIDDGLDLQLDAQKEDEPSLTVDSGAGSELDFDLGETGGNAATGISSGEDELDFDLGDTAASVAGTDRLVDEATLDSGEIDFDLGETAASIKPAADSDGTSMDEASALDFDLGDTGAGEVADAAGSESAAGEDVGPDLELGAGSDDEAPLSLDMTVDESGDDAAGSDVFQGAQTEIGGESDLDLVLDMGDDTSPSGTNIDGASDADEFPALDMSEDGGAEGGSIDTVQLSPDTMESMRPDDEGSESEFGVDTEFRGIFSDDGEGDADDNGVGNASSLDFDLGTDLGDVANADDSGADDSGDILDDLEQTQFSLRDVPSMAADEDDEDHTLALGRGASGEVDEMQTKLDLAQAYMDMGDSEGARNLLGEVMAEGGDDQQDQAREMLSKLS